MHTSSPVHQVEMLSDLYAASVALLVRASPGKPSPTRGSQFFTVSGELCCVALPFCCVVVALPFSASVVAIIRVHVLSSLPSQKVLKLSLVLYLFMRGFHTAQKKARGVASIGLCIPNWAQ